MIRLFEDTATVFTTNGIGPLPSVMSCTVTEERNGTFELEMEYPIDGKRFSDIHTRSIIVCKPNPYDEPQAFRVYSISRPINGVATINAAHISYDLNGITISPFSAVNASDALSKLKANAAVTCPFAFWTDKSTNGNLSSPTPASARSLLGGNEGSILDIYGGEYKFDNYTVRLYNNRGADNGVRISYGKNLTDIRQEENCSEVYTGVYPFYYTEEDGLHQLPEKIVNAEGSFNFRNISPLDLTYDFEEPPSEADLRNAAVQYMKDNDIGSPKVSIDISFLQLTLSKEYETIEMLEKVQLCDIVTVQFKKMGIDAKAKCVAYTYNVLTNKYEELTLGEARANLADSLSDQTQTIKNQVSQDQLSSAKSFLEEAVDQATKEITGGLGGYVIIRSSTGSKKPDEILIMDTDNINTARNVWRWNRAGLGYSKNGYNGPYGTAITQSGQIVADYITTGTLNASLVSVTNLNASNITTGTITSKNGGTVINLDTGSAKFTGEIVASSGSIGDWIITGGNITNGLPYTGESNSDATGMGPYGTDWAFWAGNGRFSVNQSGHLHASDADITGTINATDGKFSGTVYANMISGQIIGGQIAGSTITDGNIAPSTISGGRIGADTVQRGNLYEKYPTMAQYNSLSADLASLKTTISNFVGSNGLVANFATIGSLNLGGFNTQWRVDDIGSKSITYLGIG